MDTVTRALTASHDMPKMWNMRRHAFESLCVEYPTIEDLANAHLSDLKKIDGIGEAMALTIIKFASDLKGELDALTKDGDFVSEGFELSINPDKPKEAVEDEKSKKIDFISNEVYIDESTVRRRSKPWHPGMSKKTGVDIIALNKLPPYEELPERLQLAVVKAVAEHDRVYAQPGQTAIITQPKNTTWMHRESETWRGPSSDKTLDGLQIS